MRAPHTMLVTGMIASCIVVLAGGVARGDDKADVVAAINKLIEGGSYSWNTTTESAAGAGMSVGAVGKTQKDGLTELNLTLRDGDVLAYLKGGKGAYRTPDGEWKPIGGAADANNPDDAPSAALSILRGYRPPALQALRYATVMQNLAKTADGEYAGTLPLDEAKSLVQRRVGNRQAREPFAGPETRNASANVKFWIKDGTLERFELHLQATVARADRVNEIDRTTTVEIKDVGATTVDLPELARDKMN